MKNLLLLFMVCSYLFSTAQNKGIIGDKNVFANWTNYKPKNVEYKATSEILFGVISKNTTLFKKNTYLLTGAVYVTNNAVLTIEPGTVIRGDNETTGSLIITKGAKIIAQGTETDPIVFTSNNTSIQRRAGDWGGIVVMGEAPTSKLDGRLAFNLEGNFNTFGGSKSDDNSGILKFIRIEFAGKKVKGFEEYNALSLAGVGAKTVIENIQVSFSNDDSFQFYGGFVNCSNLVSYRAIDDDFDFTNGVQCAITNSVAIKNPYASSSGRPRCFEIKNFDVASNMDGTKKPTTIKAEHMTFINEESDGFDLLKEAIFINANCYLDLNNSVVSNFSNCLLLDEKIAVEENDLNKISLKNIVANNSKLNVEIEGEREIDERNFLYNWYKKPESIENTKQEYINYFVETDTKKGPDFRIKANINSGVKLTNN